MCLMRGHPVPSCPQGVQGWIWKTDRKWTAGRKQNKTKQNTFVCRHHLPSDWKIPGLFVGISGSFVQSGLCCNEIRVWWLLKVETLERTTGLSACQRALSNFKRRRGLIGCYGDEVNNEMVAKVKKHIVQCFSVLVCFVRFQSQSAVALVTFPVLIFEILLNWGNSSHKLCWKSMNGPILFYLTVVIH